MKGSFALDGTKLEPQPRIDGQVATLDSLGNLSHGDHTITYETELKSGVAANNGERIDLQETSKNTASWEWGGANDHQSGTVTAAPSKFRYGMISKSSDRNSTPTDIKWTVTLNQGELKTDMSGYVFTDKLDNKQMYTGSYTVYKGTSESDEARIDGPRLIRRKILFPIRSRTSLMIGTPPTASFITQR